MFSSKPTLLILKLLWQNQNWTEPANWLPAAPQFLGQQIDVWWIKTLVQTPAEHTICFSAIPLFRGIHILIYFYFPCHFTDSPLFSAIMCLLLFQCSFRRAWRLVLLLLLMLRGVFKSPVLFLSSPTYCWLHSLCFFHHNNLGLLFDQSNQPLLKWHNLKNTNSLINNHFMLYKTPLFKTLTYPYPEACSNPSDFCQLLFKPYLKLRGPINTEPRGCSHAISLSSLPPDATFTWSICDSDCTPQPPAVVPSLKGTTRASLPYPSFNSFLSLLKRWFCLVYVCMTRFIYSVFFHSCDKLWSDSPQLYNYNLQVNAALDGCAMLRKTIKLVLGRLQTFLWTCIKIVACGSYWSLRKRIHVLVCECACERGVD